MPWKFSTISSWLTRKKCITSCVLLLFVGSFSSGNAQISATPLQSLTVDRVNYDARTHLIDVELLNQSKLTVAAYALVIVTRYANGQEIKIHEVVDISQSIVLSRIAAPEPRSTHLGLVTSLQPGKRLHHRTAAARGENRTAPVSVDALVVTVVFADGTALGQEDDISTMRHGWWRELEEIRRWLPDLVRLRSSDTVVDDARELAARLKAVDSNRLRPPDAGAAMRAGMQQQLKLLVAPEKTDGASAQVKTAKLVELTEARATLLAYLLRSEQARGGQ